MINKEFTIVRKMTAYLVIVDTYYRDIWGQLLKHEVDNDRCYVNKDEAEGRVEELKREFDNPYRKEGDEDE